MTPIFDRLVEQYDSGQLYDLTASFFLADYVRDLTNRLLKD